MDKRSDFAAIAADWLRKVTAHRRAIRALGHVTTKVTDPGDGKNVPELHLIEETTFKPGPSSDPHEDPLEAALVWLAKSRESRKEHGTTGTFRIEVSDVNGIVTFARLNETTIISARSLDDARR